MNRTFLVLVVYLASHIPAVSQASSPKPATPAAQLQLGNKYLEEKDYSNAMIWFRQAAEKSEPIAQNNIGWLYENGFGVKQDYAEAVTWYRKAADQGYAKAQVNLGLLFEKGLGVERDYSQAMSWYHKAADKGDVRASVNVGWLYQNGFGVKQDYSEALTWYLEPANRGDARAQTNIGWFYQNGLGVKRDYGEAMAWFYRAAEKGSAQAQNNLGWLYENGLGVMPDDAKAMTWYRKAAEQGNTQAKGNIARLSRSGWPGTLESKQSEAPPASASDKVSAPVLILPNGIHVPREIDSPEPEYSEQARKAMLTGEVLVSVIVDTDGRTRDLKVLTPLGSGLDEKAVDAIKKWKFEPATKDHKSVALQLMVSVAFRLYGSRIGRVEVVDGPQGANIDSYLAPFIARASECWTKLTKDNAYTPSIKQGQVTVQFAIAKDGRAGVTEVSSSSGDDMLDREARECISTPKSTAALPVVFRGKELLVQMQLLYNGELSIAPFHPEVIAGGRKQFHFEIAGIASQAVEWSVTGAGCTESACGTISPDGLYTAPEALPDPPYVRVTATLPGANPVPTSAVVTLVGNR